MTVHNISIDNKYFEPIRNKQITLLIFKEKVIHDEQPGDCIVFSKGSYDVKSIIKRTYLKSFKDITEEESRAAGSLNKDFLKDRLINEFGLKPMLKIPGIDDLDSELFFLIELGESNEIHNTTSDVNLYSSENTLYNNLKRDDCLW